ncbi:MAG: hypothetical protein ACE5KM_18795 [Planctomycetaceae bacterium]
MNRITLPLSLLLILPLTLSVQAQKRRRRNRNVGITTLIAHPAVHRELKLKDEQKTALKQAAAEARKGFQASQKLKDQARRTRNREVNQKLRGVIAKTLNEEQRQRLLQIELQWSSGSWIINRADVAKALELTRDQRRQIRDLSKNMQESIQKLRASRNDDNRRDVQRKINAVLANAREAAIKLLTDEQRKKWKKARGETFELPRRRRKNRE